MPHPTSQHGDPAPKLGSIASFCSALFNHFCAKVYKVIEIESHQKTYLITTLLLRMKC